jgi:hypothetical protein
MLMQGIAFDVRAQCMMKPRLCSSSQEGKADTLRQKRRGTSLQHWRNRWRCMISKQQRKSMHAAASAMQC